MNINNIPIILHTCDKYNQYWNYWWYFTNKYCQHSNIIFASEEMLPDFSSKITLYRTGTGEWGSRLLNILNNVKTDYVFYMQEDFWPISSFPYTQETIDQFIDEHVHCWRICEYSYLYSLSWINSNIFRYNQNSLYTLSHQFSLWRTDFLKKYILKSENPWENETYGSLRMNKSNHKIYFQSNKWYESVVSKGILQNNGKIMLEKENINICGT